MLKSRFAVLAIFVSGGPSPPFPRRARTVPALSETRADGQKLRIVVESKIELDGARDGQPDLLGVRLRERQRHRCVRARQPEAVVAPLLADHLVRDVVVRKEALRNVAGDRKSTRLNSSHR